MVSLVDAKKLHSSSHSEHCDPEEVSPVVEVCERVCADRVLKTANNVFFSAAKHTPWNTYAKTVLSAFWRRSHRSNLQTKSSCTTAVKVFESGSITATGSVSIAVNKTTTSSACLRFRESKYSSASTPRLFLVCDNVFSLSVRFVLLYSRSSLSFQTKNIRIILKIWKRNSGHAASGLTKMGSFLNASHPP